VEWAWVAGESAPEPRRITDRQRNKENELEKRPTERYRKSRMAKNGNGNLKKKKKKKVVGCQLIVVLLGLRVQKASFTPANYSINDFILIRFYN
jgi:hypothetical protein